MEKGGPRNGKIEKKDEKVWNRLKGNEAEMVKFAFKSIVPCRDIKKFG